MSILSSKIQRICSSKCFCPVITSVKHYQEVDRRGGYGQRIKRSNMEHFREGFKILKNDLDVFRDEVVEKVREDRMLIAGHEDYEYFWKFDGAESLEPWTVTSDRDNLVGFSKAELALSKNNKALFHGYISQRLPKDGVIKNTGYANLRSPKKYKSFKRQMSNNWNMFTHLILRFRGDGRPYHLNIAMDRDFSIQWFDTYGYSLFTRGGPYWQIAKIPFSKFYLSSKGRIQDDQGPIDLENVRNFGITLGDGVEGPFQLEIDYIGLINDDSHEEEFAYEMYDKTKKLKFELIKE